MNTLIIEINKEAGQWRMSASYKSENIGHRRYSVQKISDESIEELCADIFNIFGQTDPQGRVTDKSLDELRKSASLLYDQIFSKQIKDEIRRTQATHIIFNIDEGLVHIPWELLHDGTNYLSLRFAIGRVVLTSREIQSDGGREVPTRIKMLALCDPTGDLKSAYSEGIAIRNQLDKVRKKVHVDLRTTDVSVKYTMKNIREYDVFHFAGHAKYNAEDPSKSGWVLKDGNLTAEAIMKLAGSASMPLAVFANACSSGETEAWQIEPAHENRIYGLANAFLLAGVRYYIGTFWKVLDKASLDFAKEFYGNITKGKSVGEALRFARLRLIEKCGKSSLIWASYMLYGNPEENLFAAPDKRVTTKKDWRKRVMGLAAAALILAALAGAYSSLTKRPQSQLKVNLLKDVFFVTENGRVKNVDWMSGPTQNLAYGKKMYASSIEDEGMEPGNASDRNSLTRWASKSTDDEWIYVDLGKTLPIGQIRLIWQDAYAKSYSIQISDDAKKWKIAWITFFGDGEGDIIDLTRKNISARYIRMYGRKRATEWGYSLWEFEAYPAMLPNVTAGKQSFSSSGVGPYAPDKAIDGDMNTRWGTKYEDPQWLYIDLKKRHEINMINIYWENAYASSYAIQKSDNSQNWEDVCRIKKDNSKADCIYFDVPLVTRYVRLFGIERGTDWGYSLWELEIRGKRHK